MVYFTEPGHFTNMMHNTYDFYYHEVQWMFSVMPDNYLSEFYGFLGDVCLPTRTAYTDTPCHPNMPDVHVIECVRSLISDEQRRRREGASFVMHPEEELLPSEPPKPKDVSVTDYVVGIDGDKIESEVSNDTAEFI